MGFFSGNKLEAFKSDIFSETENNIVNGKKIKEVYPSLPNLCHAWASGNVPRGRSGGSMYFENGKLYSYGSHYLAAQIHTNKKGEKLVLINSRRYYLDNGNVSQSTEGHKSTAADATRHLKTVWVPYPSAHGCNADNVQYLSNSIADMAENILSMKSGYNSVDAIEETYKELKNYCKFFGLKVPFKLDADFLEDLKASKKAATIKRAARRKKYDEREALKLEKLKVEHAAQIALLNENFPKVLDQWKKYEISNRQLGTAAHITIKTKGAFGHEKRITLDADVKSFEIEIKREFEKRNAESIRAWKSGEISARDIEDILQVGSIEIDLRSDLALLRVKGNNVETSEGADVPLTHAIRLLNLIETKQARKGERVGHYTLESVSDLKKEPVIITIGCHKIDLNEARKVLNPYKNSALKLVK